MAKIGTAHVEIKPVLNEESLAEISARVERSLREAVLRGLGEKRVIANEFYANRETGEVRVHGLPFPFEIRPDISATAAENDLGEVVISLIVDGPVHIVG